MVPIEDVSAAADVPPPIERLIGMTVFAPLDLTIRVVEELPSAVAGARQQLLAARFIGKMVVDQGVGEMRRRLGIDDAPAPSAERPATADEPGPTREEAPTVTDQPRSEPRSVPDDLALPDYEQLPASHVVAKLAGLTPSERDDIEAFESAHRHRRTILGKLDQLRES